MATSQVKTLVAMDFDHTIVDTRYLRGLHRLLSTPLPAATADLMHVDGVWSDYLAGLFDHLHHNGVSADSIQKCVQNDKLVDGMGDLLSYLRGDAYEVIVISDANVPIIDWLLTKHGVREQVQHIYANPASFDKSGRLVMEYYHLTDCPLSNKNLCKGQVLEDHIKERKANGVEFSRVCFIGDGSNDYCPTLRLSENDCVFPRDDFPLECMLREDNSGVKAATRSWSSGTEIIEILKSQPFSTCS